jgi:hypothetical protein
LTSFSSLNLSKSCVVCTFRFLISVILHLQIYYREIGIPQ